MKPGFIALFVCAAFAAKAQDVIWQTTASRAIAISPDAQLMLTGADLRNTSDGSLIKTFKFGYTGGSSINADAFSPDGTLAAIAVQAYNQNLLLFRIADGVRLGAPITAHSNGTTCVAFSPDGQLLASGGRDGTVKLWHVPDMTLLQTLNGGVDIARRSSPWCSRRTAHWSASAASAESWFTRSATAGSWVNSARPQRSRWISSLPEAKSVPSGEMARSRS